MISMNKKEEMRVADYIANFLYKNNITDVFMLTGGGAMFLNDGIAKYKKINVICNHHEQACAMGAVGYAKYKNDLAAVIVTTGCGVTNSMTGLLDAWQDNVPCVFISGQVKSKETTRNSGLPLRQFGVQEADIIPVVKSLTKYAVMVNDANRIAYHLEEAVFLAKSGRPGPVWLDVPMDIQGAIINTSTLTHYQPPNSKSEISIPLAEINEFKQLLTKAKRPIVIAGNGIRLADALTEFRDFIEQNNLPVVVSYLGVDFLEENHPLYVGRLGIKGDRAGNFAVQNSDLVISIGCRLSVALTGFEYDQFARAAKIVVIDIDPNEHKKNTVRIDSFIHSDAKQFFVEVCNENIATIHNDEWVKHCQQWKLQWPVTLRKYDDDGINLYQFMSALSNQLKEDSVVVSDAGSSYYVVSQALKLHNKKQRYITSGAQADMGFTTPAAIGVCVARDKNEVIGITGDGSFQLNLQELQTIVHYNFPIKLFIWNNNGYLSIRATQRKFFNSRFIGTDPKSGVSFPNIEKLSIAYGIKYYKLELVEQLEQDIKQVLAYDGPVLCEVICPPDQEIIPAVSSLKKDDGTMVSKPLEDMYPFLPRDEFYENMIVEPVKE
ncbi:MAG: thiamine pyrophosphate-binding protein [Gammaproteobacteria bacterium]|nr:MAG: thiamine pyrophosphate-binding protein [Gammaproteobacteria bacterium]